MRLKELHIQNFKFFPKQDVESPLLKIDGKNLLLYGENGSGKSTIYWALYTLLESSFKKTDAEVAKYFEYRGPNGLVNIYASRSSHNAYIKAILCEPGITKEYKVSGLLNDIQTIRANSNVRESGMASEFLNYKILLGLHQARNSNDNNLFGWFEHEILPYIRTRTTDSFEEVLEMLRKGPRIVNDLVGDMIFSNATMRTDPNPAIQAHFKHYRIWENKVSKWKNELKVFLRKINIRANEILQQDFKQELEIKLDLIPPRYNVLSNAISHQGDLSNLNWFEPEIRITIPRYLNRPNAVFKAHSFLNEAKWTAIGLSIRLAILEDTTYKPSPVDLKCLVLDDVLLNLDMSNRDIITKYVLDNLSNDYQIILSTCDRSYFNWVKNELEYRGQLEATGNWKALEMYVDEKINGIQKIECPKILTSGDELTIAIGHYKSHDYAAAANYLRKYAETLLCSWLPKVCWEDVQDKNKSNAKVALYNIVENGMNIFWSSFNIVCNEYIELRKYVRVLLNPLSHADVGVERYKSEIKEIIQALENIKKLHTATSYNSIIAGGELVQIRLNNPASGQVYVGEYELSSSLYLLNHRGNTHYSSLQGKITKCFPINPDNTIPQEFPLNGTTKEMQVNYTDFQTRYMLTPVANWMDALFKTNGIKLI